MSFMKIAFFSIHPAPYRDPLLNYLSQKEGVVLDVFSYQAVDYGHDFWKLDEPQYRNISLKTLPGTRGKLHRGILKTVLFSGYDVFFWPGFLSFSSLLGMWLCALLRKHYVVTLDSVKDSGSKKNKLREFIKKFFFNHAKLLFVPGAASANFLMDSYGIPPRRICAGAYCMDPRIYADIAELHQQKETIKKRLGLQPGEKIFLMVANMIKKRKYPLTAEAFLQVSKKFPNMRFLMIGKGEDYEKILEMASQSSALFPVNGCSFDALKEFYAVADVYVHGGKEPASTALLMGAGSNLPLISSYSVGFSLDCLEDGKSGFLVEDYADLKCWVSAFERAMTNENKWESMGAVAYEKNKAFDPGVVAEKMLSLLKK